MEIYTHSEAKMQLIFSKKTQIFLVIVKKTTFYISYNEKPTL